MRALIRYDKYVSKPSFPFFILFPFKIPNKLSLLPLAFLQEINLP